MKVVDTNVFVQYLLDGERASEAEELLASNPDLATTVGIVNEVEFVIIRRLAKERLGIRKLSKLKKYIRAKGVGFALDILEKYTEMLLDLNIMILKDHAEPRELLNTIVTYRLTPSDAVIALTCKHYGVGTIITFDKEDFSKIPWLKVLP